ncbi:MAG: SRPBCC family protein [Erythrobacter sp.]
MRQANPAPWPYLAAAGIGLATIPLAAGVNATRRRSFGEYEVVGRSVTIARPHAELFAFWRDVSNLPTFVANLVKVEPVTDDPERSTWHIKGPLDTTFLISQRLPLEEATTGYKNFKQEQDTWTKVVLKPEMERGSA